MRGSSVLCQCSQNVGIYLLQDVISMGIDEVIVKMGKYLGVRGAHARGGPACSAMPWSTAPVLVQLLFIARGVQLQFDREIFTW